MGDDRTKPHEVLPQPPGVESEEPAVRPGEPPVVARLVVEIRSDGTRTVARGAMEDVASGQKVAVEARGDSPLSLALSLARTIASGPRLAARTAARALLPGRRSKRR